MKMPKIIYYPARTRSPYMAIRKFGLNHRISTAIGALTLTIILVQVISTIIEISRRKRYSPETEMIDKALKAIHSGNLDKAFGIAKKAALLYPHSDNAFYLKGVIYLQKRQYEDAVEDLQRAIKINSNHGEYFMSKSIAQFHLGKIRSSVISLKKAKSLMDNQIFLRSLSEAGLTELTGLLKDDIVLAEGKDGIEGEEIEHEKKEREEVIHEEGEPAFTN